VSERVDDRILSLRRQLAAEIVRSLGPMGQYLGTDYGLPQPRMSELTRGIVDRCTVEWLIRRVHALGGEVTLTIRLGDAASACWRAGFARMRTRHRARGGATCPAPER